MGWCATSGLGSTLDIWYWIITVSVGILIQIYKFFFIMGTDTQKLDRLKCTMTVKVEVRNGILTFPEFDFVVRPLSRSRVIVVITLITMQGGRYVRHFGYMDGKLPMAIKTLSHWIMSNPLYFQGVQLCTSYFFCEKKYLGYNSSV